MRLSYQNLRIRYKLTLILGLALGGLAAISIVYALAEAQLEAMRSAQRHRLHVADAAADAFLAMSRLEITANQLNRYSRGNAINRFKMIIPQLTDRMTALRLFTAGEPMGANVTALKVAADDYLANFDGIAATLAELGLSAGDGLEGRLRAAAHKLEALLVADKATANASELPGILTLLDEQLTMRQREKEFIFRGKTKYVTAWEAAVRSFVTHLRQWPGNGSEQVEREELLKDYIVAFRSFVLASDRLDEQLIDSSRHSALVLDRFAKLRDMTNAASQKGLVEEQALRDRLVMLLLLSLIGVAVLLGGGAVVLARGISGPLLRLAATMRKLAAGDLTVEVPETNRGDEIGMMARTVKVFRRNARRIAVLQKETEAAKLRAEEAVQSKSLFIANTSHELRTPLNAIIGFSDFLAQGPAGPLNAKQAEYVADIHGAGQHLLSVINDILDLSKVEAGRMTLAQDTIDVADMARGCLRMVEPHAQETGLALVADIAPDLPPLRADALRLRQVLLNLVSNAVKFTSAGGSVTIRASRAANGDLGISVKDTGVGMDADQIETALEMYGQVTSPLTGVHEGTGLGLPLSKKLVELLGGTFALASTPGKGTVVSLTFPADRLGKPPVSR